MNTMNITQSVSRLTASAALFGAAGVILGAFGAHLLKDSLAEAGTLEVWKTAVFYHLVHAVASMAVGFTRESRLSACGWVWLVGIVFFSGSLYCMALGGPRWMGPITPFGGILFLVGWLWIAAEAFRSRGGSN